MRGHGDKPSSLLPPRHELDLAVSITDFFGISARCEDQHAVPDRGAGARAGSGLSSAAIGLDGMRKPLRPGDSNVPGLALAARATSSFPGAFPPVQLSDLEGCLRSGGWTGRIWQNLSPLISGITSARGVNPEITSFSWTGGIVNNKPFSVVLNMVRERPAYRDVDRRLVFIEPDPERSSPPPGGDVPQLHTDSGRRDF